jgi:hypothetical protein
LFTRCFSKLNGEIPISENFKNINAFSASEPEIFGELQDFIEKNGKPCCLNLITDKDNKFLKNLTKAHQAPATHEGGEHHDGAADEHKESAVDEDDELAIIMKNEEEDNRKRAEEEKEQNRDDTRGDAESGQTIQSSKRRAESTDHDHDQPPGLSYSNTLNLQYPPKDKNNNMNNNKNNNQRNRKREILF